MDDIEKLAKWLQANDSLGGSFDRQTDEMTAEWQLARSALAAAVLQAMTQHVAEDEILFAEAIAPVQNALARLQKSLSTWQAFLKEIVPDIEPINVKEQLDDRLEGHPS